MTKEQSFEWRGKQFSIELAERKSAVSRLITDDFIITPLDLEILLLAGEGHSYDEIDAMKESLPDSAKKRIAKTLAKSSEHSGFYYTTDSLIPKLFEYGIYNEISLIGFYSLIDQMGEDDK